MSSSSLEERYLCEAGYPRAIWRAPADPEQRRVWENWLMGMLVAIGTCVAVTFFLSKGYGPQETTAQMERIVKQLDQIKTITPETARAIERMVSQPSYKCDHLPCDAQLKDRNHAVRAQLATLLAAKTSGEEVASSQRPAGRAVNRRPGT
jgi:hypothetical protein